MPNYGPHEYADTLFLEKTFMLSAFVYTIGYGMQIVMYINCASYLWKQCHSSQGKYAFFRLAYITVLLILESVVVATSLRVLLLMYTNHIDYPGGPLAWFLASAQPFDSTVFASLFLLTSFSDLLVLWRCWVIWSPTGKLAANTVLCAPVLMLLSSLVLGIMWAYQSSRPGLSLYSQLSIEIGTAYYVTSLGVNLLLTILIITRLLLYRRAVLKSLPAGYTKHYISVATIVVESVFFYSVFALAFIITYALKIPMNQIFMYMGSACQQIAGYMIILRVAQGRALTSNALALSTVSTNIRFYPPATTTQELVESRLDYPYDRDSSTTVVDIRDSV